MMFVMSAFSKVLSPFGQIMLISFTLLACKQEMEPQCEDFLQQPFGDRRISFLEHSLYEQVDLYICVTKYSHPVDRWLAFSLASRGKVVVPLLLERIESEQEDYVKVEILYVFEQIQTRSSYDVCSDRETMRVLEKTVNSLSEPWNEMGVVHLEQLKELSNRHLTDF